MEWTGKNLLNRSEDCQSQMSELHRRMALDLNIKIDPCVAPVWARGGQAQTLMAFWLPGLGNAKAATQNFKIPLRDGDRLWARYFVGKSPFLVVIFHGLTGNIDSKYMQGAARVALEAGHSVVLVNHRNCGEGMGLAKNPYHSGRGEDVSDVVRFFREHLPTKKIIGIGFSLGANALLNLMTGQRGESQPDAAIAFNGPIDLKSCSELLGVGFNRLYDFVFVEGIRKDLRAKSKFDPDMRKIRIPLGSRLSYIDEIYTAPEGRFKDAQDYYQICSTYQHLDKIEKPTVMITAKDDPFIVWEPYLNASKNPNIHLRIEDVGGHLGYLTKDRKNPVGYSRWMEEAIGKYLSALTS